MRHDRPRRQKAATADEKQAGDRPYQPEPGVGAVLEAKDLIRKQGAAGLGATCGQQASERSQHGKFYDGSGQHLPATAAKRPEQGALKKTFVPTRLDDRQQYQDA